MGFRGSRHTVPSGQGLRPSGACVAPGGRRGRALTKEVRAPVAVPKDVGIPRELPTDVPLLSDLTKIQIAKLIPNLEVCVLDQGEFAGNDDGDAIYCIREGRAEVVAEVGQEVVLLVALGPGETFGPLAGGASAQNPTRLRATTPLKLVQISRKSFADLCEKHPNVFRSVSRQLTGNISALEKELIRTKLILKAHATELWALHTAPDASDLPVDEVPAELAAAAAAGHDPLPVPPVVPPAPLQLLSGQVLRWAAVGSVLLILAGKGWWASAPMLAVTAVLAWGALNWYLGFVPDYGVALAMLGGLVVLEVAPKAVTLSGFTSETWFLVLGIYGLGAAINQTGLLYRFALLVLRRLPPTYRGQSLALALTGLILTPALPSANGRVTMASPLAHELASAMRLAPQSRESAGLALSVLHGFGQMFFLFMNGTGNCLVVWGLLPPEVRDQVTWFRWLQIALPLGLLVFLGFFAFLMWSVRAQSGLRISRRTLQLQAATLGPMNRSERITFVVTAGVLLSFVLQPLHGLHPAWPAVGGLLLLMVTQVIDRTTFVTRVDWASLLLFGSLWSLAAVIRHAGLDIEMGQVVSGLLAPIAATPWLFMVALGLTTLAMRVVVPWEAAIPLMMVAATPVLLAAGYNPFIGGLVVLATSNPFFLPQQNVVYLTVYQGTEEQDITHWQAARYGIVHAVVTLLSIGASTFWWNATGALGLG